MGEFLTLPLTGAAALAAVNPNTGDNNVVWIALIVGGVALLLLLAMLFFGKRKK